LAKKQSTWIWPAAGLGAAFLLKLVVVVQLKDHPLLQPDAGLDTTAYVDLARRVLGGDVGLGPGLYYVSPLYIYFLALSYGLTRSFTAVRVIQAALGTVTIACVFLMAREWFGRRAAWIAAASAALCGVLIFYEVLLQQSGLDGVLTAAGLCALTFALRGRGEWWYVAAGAIFGLHTLNRPNMLVPAVAFVLMLLLLRRVKVAAWLAAGVLVGLAPATIRNVVVAHEWSLVSSHGGLNFYTGNHAGATGLYEIVPGVRPGIEGQRDDTRRVAEAAVGHPLTDVEVSDYFFGLGRSWILANPGSALALMARKFLLVFHADHVPLPSSYDFFADDANTLLRWLIVNPWLLVPLGLVGLAGGTRREHRVEFLVWASFVVTYAVAVAVFFVAERYRVPLLIPLAVGTGGLISRAIDAARSPDPSSRRWLAIAGGAAVVLLVLVRWPVALSDSREGDRVRMAMRAAETGRYDEAEHWAALAIEASTSPAGVQATIGHGLVAAGQAARALPYLQQARGRGSQDPQLVLDLAEALKGTGDNAAALATLQAIQFPAGSDVTLRLQAGRLGATLGAADFALDQFREVVRVRPDLADAWAQLGFSLLLRGELDDAARALTEAVRLNARDAVALGGLAVCDLRLGRREDALAHATAALAINPREALASQVMAALKSGRETGPSR
jgi:4-amino-4-deoxy-L-arabinose transferase-like glycosyltransferase/Flp pilus assembly protein TadD